MMDRGTARMATAIISVRSRSRGRKGCIGGTSNVRSGSPRRPDHARMIRGVADRRGQLQLGLGSDEIADGAFLGGADLEDQLAAGDEVSRGTDDEAGDDAETVLAAVEGEAGLVVADAGLERGHDGRRDVGGVGEDGIK